MALWQGAGDWAGFGQPLEEWLDEAATGLALASLSAVAVLDCESVIIDGAMPAAIRSRLVEATKEKVAALDRRGLSSFAVAEGTIGDAARVMGGASVPLLSNFAIDRDVLFKDNA
jgi:predicted NBD/HSP70 family sugar kinase